MSKQPLVVISSEEAHPELHSWVGEFAVLMRVLLVRASLSGALDEVQLHRKAGYVFVDALGFFVALSCWNRHGAIKEFSRISHKDDLGRKLAAICGRRDWPVDSSMSRLLGSVRQQDTEQFRRHILPLAQPGSLASNVLVMHRDTLGQLWAVFDLDGIVKAFRRRALPHGADLPEAQRWTDDLAAPGYPGRKRGETQVSSHRLQQAGSQMWLGQDSVPGNTVMSDATVEVVTWLLQFCAQVGLDKQHVVVRIDGAGGNTPCVNALHQAGIPFLVRWPNYAPLDWPEVRAHLRGEVWAPVTSSRAEVQRHAAELGTGRWLAGANQLPADTRLVVSRFFSAEAGQQRGAGHIIGPAQYELFATNLDECAWPAEDVVSFYFGRATHENSLAQGNADKGLKRMFCKTNRHGQNLVQMILMLVWNLEASLGARLLELPQHRPAQAARPARQVRSFADIPVLVVPEAQEPKVTATPVTSSGVPGPAPTAGLTAPSAATPCIPTLPVAALRAEVAKRPGWSVNDQHQVLCPAGAVLRLRRNITTPAGHQHLHFRARQQACATCSCRRACTSSTASDFQKDMVVTIAAPVVTLLDGPGDGVPSGSASTVASPPSHSSTWTPPEAAPPGPWVVDGPAVVPADLRTAFHRACEDVVIRVELPAPLPRVRAPHHLVFTAAQRQRRRHTFGERAEWNALPDGPLPKVTLLHAEAVAALLADATVPLMAA